MPSPSGAVAAPEPTTPLAGIRVVDLSTTLPGAFCTQFLADCGADVLMIEAPGGTALRFIERLDSSVRVAWPFVVGVTLRPDAACQEASLSLET